MSVKRTATCFAVFLALIAVINADWNGEQPNRPTTPQSPSNPICNNPDWAIYFPECRTSTTPDSTFSEFSTAAPFDFGSTPASQVPGEPWCRFKNGTYIPLDYKFVYNGCSVCQCLQNRAIRCQNIQCIQSYCIDDSLPTKADGQCCSQCSYENQSMSCQYKGLEIPHGTIVKRTSTNINCWCQSGSIECRKFASQSSSSSFWDENSSMLIGIIVVCVVLVVGMVSCSVCGFIFYNYYKQKQTGNQAIQEQYLNNVGWQPMDEANAAGAAEKQVEAEGQFVPPPYAIYNGAYVSEAVAETQRNA